MALQLLNTGTAVNDGTGDTLHTAGLKINSNFTELYNGINIPNATTTTYGTVKPDNTTIKINNGVISTIASGQLTNVLNGVTATLVLNNDGSLTFFDNSVQTTAYTGTAFPSQSGQIGKYLTTNGTTLSWGTVATYTLPQATTSTLGGVKVDGTTITASGGIISAVGYSLPLATTSIVGGVKVDGTSIAVAGDGTISVGTLPSLTVTNKTNIGSQANNTRFPNAQVVVSTTSVGIQQNESHNIGVMAEGTGSVVTTTVTGTSGQNTITVGSNTGLYVGQLVTGTGIGANAVITVIAGTTITLSVNNSGAVSGSGTFVSVGAGLYGAGYTSGAARSGGVVGEGHVSATGDTGSAIGIRGYANDTHSGGSNIGLYGDAQNGLTNYALYMNQGNIYSANAQTWTLNGNLSFSGAYSIALSGDITGIATQNVFNTTSTSVSAFGAATTLAIGNTATAAQTVNMFTASTGASTYNFATGATLNATTKAINIGTNGVAGSTTATTIGSAAGTSTIQLNGVVTTSGAVKFNGALQSGGGATNITLTNNGPTMNGVTTMGIVATAQAAGTIASATTIAPTNPITFVSGTTAIATITAPSGIASFGGQITIIPTGLWTTTTAGNIALASTAVVNRAMTFTYDATALKWYPSY